jgi:hypothetical protein
MTAARKKYLHELAQTPGDENDFERVKSSLNVCRAKWRGDDVKVSNFQAPFRNASNYRGYAT